MRSFVTIVISVLLCAWIGAARAERPCAWVPYHKSFRAFYQQGKNAPGRRVLLEIRDASGRHRQVLLGDADWQGRRPGEGTGERIVHDHEVVVRYCDVSALLAALTAGPAR